MTSISWLTQDAASPLSDDLDRRVLNFSVALMGIVVTLPLMAVIAILVKVSSPGPALFLQTRIGLNRRGQWSGPPSAGRQRDLGGAPFVMYKFRTMAADGDDTPRWATPGDARVTSVGRILRRFRLDELPQLFNVLAGDMNVVGPRPEQPDIFRQLSTELHGYAWRQVVHPGITGWAQIHLGYDRTTDDARRKLEYDLDYIRRRSTFADLRIMVQTLPVMIGHKGS